MLTFNWYSFTELSLTQLYAVLALRASVFVVEQNCAYLDIDGKDQMALHLLGMHHHELQAYLRLFPPTATQKEIVFGRIATSLSARQQGHGKKLMHALLNYCATHFPDSNIRCSAQYYLKDFYESFGFEAEGAVYLEDDIPHIAMLKKA